MTEKIIQREKYDNQLFNEINEKTSFAEGDEFDSENEVIQYFTIASFVLMYGECEFIQDELDDFAQKVLRYKWHCIF